MHGSVRVLSLALALLMAAPQAQAANATAVVFNALRREFKIDNMGKS